MCGGDEIVVVGLNFFVCGKGRNGIEVLLSMDFVNTIGSGHVEDAYERETCSSFPRRVSKKNFFNTSIVTVIPAYSPTKYFPLSFPLFFFLLMRSTDDYIIPRGETNSE